MGREVEEKEAMTREVEERRSRAGELAVREVGEEEGRMVMEPAVEGHQVEE